MRNAALTIGFHERGLDLQGHPGGVEVSREAEGGAHFYLSLVSSFVTKRS